MKFLKFLSVLVIIILFVGSLIGLFRFYKHEKTMLKNGAYSIIVGEKEPYTIFKVNRYEIDGACVYFNTINEPRLTKEHQICFENVKVRIIKN